MNKEVKVNSNANASHIISNEANSNSDMNLIWLDMEMTGLLPNFDRILEVAILITDSNLNIIAEAPVLVLYQDQALLNNMDAWNKSTHQRSGLLEKVANSTLYEGEAQELLLEFVKAFVPKNKSPMCGNSICQDRRFLSNYMPALEAYFHYRNLDVSTIKELCKRWQPKIASGFRKKQLHTALADIYESVEELKYYRQHFMDKFALD